MKAKIKEYFELVKEKIQSGYSYCSNKVKKTYMKLKSAFKNTGVQTKQFFLKILAFLGELDIGALCVFLILIAFTDIAWYNCIIGSIGIYYLYLTIRRYR